MTFDAAAKFFSNPDLYLKASFMIQLPYLNGQGRPICVDTTHGYADSLVLRHKTHKLLPAGGGQYVLTPIVRAATDVAFQISEPAL